MKRNIVRIDEDKCNGCGLCINACHEGALQLVDGKAKLVSESYCDGLGHCLPECPTGAITIEEREAEPFDEEAVLRNMKENRSKHRLTGMPTRAAVPGAGQRLSGALPPRPGLLRRLRPKLNRTQAVALPDPLVPANAPYFRDAHLLVAADCTAYAYASIHEDFMKNKVTIIGCPKLDEGDYSEKLTDILRLNDIKSVTVLRMEVPCCGGIVNAVKNALLGSGKLVPWQVVTIGTDGTILND